jgi:hypothetical protein
MSISPMAKNGRVEAADQILERQLDMASWRSPLPITSLTGILHF